MSSDKGHRLSDLTARCGAPVIASGLLMVLTVLALSCTGDVCGDIWDRSPAQLLQENDCVMLARVDRVDTVMELGTLEYLGDMRDFALVSYALSSVRTMQSPETNTRFDLWICELSSASYNSGPDFDPGDTVLVNGNEVRTADRLIWILSPIAPQDDLNRILHGIPPKLDWNTRSVDSTLAVKIAQADTLKELLEEKQRRGEVVLYCPEEFCLTMKDFQEGALCYYDSLGVGHKASSAEYLRMLEGLSSQRKSGNTN